MAFTANPQPATRVTSAPNVTPEKPAVSERFAAPGFTPTGPGPGPDPVLPDPVDVTVTSGQALDYLGGDFLVFGGATYLDTSRDSDDLSTWTGSNPLTLSPELPATVELISPDTDYRFGEFSVEVRLERPGSVTGVAAAELARFEIGGAAISIDEQRQAFGLPFGGVVTVPDAEWVQLRIVRGPFRVWAFVNDVEVLNHPAITPAAGAITLSAELVTAGAEIRTRWRNFTVRSHAAIDNLLLINKAQDFRRQLTGITPPAVDSIAGLGAATAYVFGLFGWGEAPVTYVATQPLTTGTEVVRFLNAYIVRPGS